MNILILTNEGTDPSTIGIQLLIIAILILINAFLAASELSILSANPYKIDYLANQNNKKAKLVKKLKEDETKFLSTIQVGITLAGFFSSATAAVSLSSGFGELLTSLNIPFGSEIALIIVTLVLSYFTLVLGELLPKRIALRNPEKTAMSLAGLINIIRIIFKPVVFLLSGSCELLVKLFRLNSKVEDKVTEEEVKALVSSGVEDGTIDEDEQEMINAVFTFGDLKVRDVMTPRIKVCMIDICDDIENIKRIIKEEQYTRIPVYKNNKDDIIGILNIKDIIIALDNEYTNMELEDILRKPSFVIENMPADNLFKKMQKEKNHSAIVIDEQGIFIGFITMEDLIEEIVGNIDDEYDESIYSIRKIHDNTYLIDGSVPIQDINRELDLNIKKENETYSSLAGMVLDICETFPKEDTVLLLDEYHISLQVVKIEKNRIKTIKLKINKEEEK